MCRWRVVLLLVVLVSAVSIAPAAAGDPEDFETLVAPDARGGDRFGYSIAVDGNRIVIGAPYDRLPLSKLGSIWVFTRHGLGWTTEKIIPDQVWRKGGGPNVGRRFGLDLDIVGDRIVVGAPNAWINGVETGGVFLYDLIDGEWVETILEPEGVDSHDGIGYQVELSEDGNRILVGSYKSSNAYFRPGKAFLYELIDGEWVSHMFEPSDGKPVDRFGSSVGFGDGFVAFGSPNHSAAGKEAGAIYIYERIDGEWSETKVVADDPAAGMRFGIWIFVYGDVILTWDTDWDRIHFVGRDGDGWAQEVVTIEDPGDAAIEAVEDTGLPIVGDLMFSAVWENDYASRSTGAVKVLERTPDEWVEVDRYEGSEFGEGFGFGLSIIPRPDFLAISAPWFKLNGEASGLVFVRGMPPVCGNLEPSIVGTNGDDELWGTPGDDVIVPGSGSDVIHVSGGRDVYCLNDGEYLFSGAAAFTRSGPEGGEILVSTLVRPEWRMLFSG